MKPQAPSQVASEFAGTGQVVQSGPHAVGLSSSMQSPLHSCEPPGQTPSQAASSSMHVPTHGFSPAGHFAPHAVPSQVALPPVGASHGVQAAPQWSVESSSTQAPSHSCVPSGQLHAPAVHEPPVGHSADVQHAATGMHPPSHSLVPSLQASGSPAEPALPPCCCPAPLAAPTPAPPEAPISPPMAEPPFEPIWPAVAEPPVETRRPPAPLPDRPELPLAVPELPPPAPEVSAEPALPAIGDGDVNSRSEPHCARLGSNPSKTTAKNSLERFADHLPICVGKPTTGLTRRQAQSGAFGDY